MTAPNNENKGPPLPPPHPSIHIRNKGPPYPPPLRRGEGGGQEGKMSVDSVA